MSSFFDYILSITLNIVSLYSFYPLSRRNLQVFLPRIGEQARAHETSYRNHQHEVKAGILLHQNMQRNDSAHGEKVNFEQIYDALIIFFFFQHASLATERKAGFSFFRKKKKKVG